MKFKVTSAFILRGDRIRKGTVVDLTDAEASTHVSEVEALGGPVPKPKPVAEKPLDKMTVAELKAKAAELELSAAGSKADLQERITLHLAGAADQTKVVTS